MKKRMLALLTALALCAVLFPAGAASAAESGELDGLLWEASNGAVSIVGYTEALPPELTIPAEIQGMPVTAVGDFAFSDCAAMRSVTIPGSVTRIGEYAFFYCVGLRGVSIPGSVSSIGDSAFGYCSSLTGITIPDSAASLGNYLFLGCVSLRSVSLPGTLTRLGDGTFTDCTALGSVTIPAGVTAIGDGAFYRCGALQSVTIPESVTYVGAMAFYGCGALRSAVIPAGVTAIENSVFYSCRSLTDVNIPEGVTSIGDCAFYECALSSVTVPDSVSEIGYGAFLRCGSLTQATLGSGVTAVGDLAFAECGALGTVVFRGGAPTFGNDVFSGVTANADYPAAEPSWTEEVRQDLGGTLTWLADGVPAPVTYRLDASAAGGAIEIGGVRYVPDADGIIRLDAPPAFSLAVVCLFNTAGGDPHGQYPTHMKVYRITGSGKNYRLTALPELDDLLLYAGSSIRITGKRGIRMITSVPAAKRAALTGAGLAGFRLLEYGTAVVWADQLGGGELTLSTPGVKTAYAYKRGVADPIYKNTGSMIQFTNVLVGFTAEQCAPDLVMRPYVKLTDGSGAVVTIYGGAVRRSIGYIAWQNRSAFAPGSESYEFIWGLIRAAYGDLYEAEYKG